ncbi:citrate lyase holo-[acyl-carrier protein] synthase [Streptomyces huiliensis]|uniref:citrate lyase holo-[acyl-carrier protein] synthase n=1 Tax=Streptomyces huiliensis TaxID=2876027 RepID=UPI001CBCC4A6|nr:citrate lyase holo-[acyl-carrier protein] synthase [Streptomyces huiliensis]
MLAWRELLDARALALHRPDCTTVMVSPRSPAGTFPPAAARRLHDAALSRLLPALGGQVARATYPAPTGPVTLLVIAAGARRVKLGCLETEERDAVGELTDADVVLPAPLGRGDLGRPPRPCLVCGEPAKRCIVLRRHPRELVVLAARRLYARAFHDPSGLAPPADARHPHPHPHPHPTPPHHRDPHRSFA